MKRRRKATQRGSGRHAALDRERILGALRGRPRRALGLNEIARLLGVRGGTRRGLTRQLSQLAAEGALERVRGGYRSPRADGLVEATLSGAVATDDRGGAWRVGSAQGAHSGDRVLLQPLDRDRAELLHILEGGRETWVGIFERRGAEGVVTPYRDDAEWTVIVAPRDRGSARDGQVVEVAPAGRPRRDGTPRGRVLEVLGRPGDADADVRALVWRHRLPTVFSAAVLEAADALPEQIDAGELARRVDLRELPFVTIDPSTARDHDDAVCVAPAEGGATRLWVAIADVSHYVPPGSPIDLEARRRGNSVYFPDRAIPMLPERLSSGLCSLREGVDRLAFTVELRFDGDGRVSRRAFYPSVIRSRARLVYEDAAAAIEGDGGPASRWKDPLQRFAALAETLGRRRRKQGTLDFDLPEIEVVFGPDRRPARLLERSRTRAHRAVEEAMLAANRAVAEALDASGSTAIFRNHESPLPKDLEELVELFERFGLRAPRSFSAGDIAAALEAVAGRPGERAFHRAVLRSMRQARYEARNRGHFALGFAHYVHFTSPIRRYADLEVHRALAATLDNRVRASGDAAALAARLSWRERLATLAERESVDMATCAVMAQHVGGEFEGSVTGVARHGLYVTLDGLLAEGLVHVSRLPGFYHLDERSQALVARGSRRRFRLGDRLRVRVDSVDPIRVHMNFSLASH